MLGLAAVATTPRVVDMGILLLVALAFHSFAYLLNDVVDLPIDRTQPSRAAYPLVAGAITPNQALFLALTQIPLAIGLSWWRWQSITTAGWLLLAFACLAVYDLWGKKSAVPPFTDLIQGLGWAALMLVGATIDGQPSLLAWLLFAYITLYIVLINGVNASLRDLDNDRRYGVVTTAVLLGARFQSDGQLLIPARLRLYAFVWQGVLFALGLGIAWLLSEAGGRITAVFLIVFLNSIAIYLLYRLTEPSSMAPATQPFYMLHIMAMLAQLVLLFWLYTASPFRWVLVATFMLPLFSADWLLERLPGTGTNKKS